MINARGEKTWNRIKRMHTEVREKTQVANLSRMPNAHAEMWATPPSSPSQGAERQYRWKEHVSHKPLNEHWLFEELSHLHDPQFKINSSFGPETDGREIHMCWVPTLHHWLCQRSSPETSSYLQAEHHYPGFVAEKSKAQKWSNPPKVRAQNWGKSRAGLRIHFCHSKTLSPGDPKR